MGAQGGHEARPYSANEALTTYSVVRIRYRICAVDNLGFDTCRGWWYCISNHFQTRGPRKDSWTTSS